MAEVLAQKLGVPPTENAVPVSQINNAPTRSTLTPAQEFDAAVDSGDPKLLNQVAQVNANTPVGVAATRVADLFYQGQQAVNKMMEPIEKAGGLQTPEGRMQVAKQAQTYFKQEDPKYFDAFIHALTGNKKMAQAMITGGDVLYKTVVDEKGNQYQVGMNALGKIIDAEDIQGRKISRQEFDALKIGRQSYENTLDYLQSKQINEQNTTGWLAKQKRDANAEAAYNGVIAPLAARMYDDLEFVKGLDLDPQQRANLFRFANTALGATSSRSQGLTTLDQMQRNQGFNMGKDVSDTDATSLGLPMNLFQYGVKGLVNKKTGETISFDQLRQSQSTSNKQDEIDSRYTQDKASFAKYLQTSGLSKEQQDRVLRVFDSSKEIGKSLLKLEAEGMPSFIFTPNASDAEDPYGLIQGKNIQLIANQQLLRMNGEYSRGAFEAARRKGGILPSPAEIDAGFTRTDQFRQVVDQGMNLTNETLKRYAAQPTRKVDVRSPVAPTETAVTRPLGAPPPVDQFSPTASAEIEQARTGAEVRGAPVMNEIPRGYEDSGQVTPNGEKLIRKIGDKSKQVFVLGDVLRSQQRGRQQ